MRSRSKKIYLRATSLIGIDGFFDEYGLDAAAELAAVNIDPAAMTDFTKLISLDSFNKMMLRLAKRTGVESIGIDFALRAPHNLDNIGPLALVLKLGDTTGECAQNAIRYLKFLTNGLDVKIVEHADKGLGEFRYSPFPPLANTRHLAEHALATARSAMALLLMDDSIQPEKITFRHTAPHDLSAHAKHFGCPIIFEAETNSMFFDVELLQVKTEGTDEQVAQIVYSYLEAEIEKLSEDVTMEELVETAILQILPSGHCSKELVSKAVGVHPKQLQRRLREEGVTYSEVLERCRLQSAHQLLTETNIPINSIARSCGYSNAAAFNLAFKKWRNQTPMSYRETNSTDLEAV